MSHNLALAAVMLVAVVSTVVCADDGQEDGARWGDRGDGTFGNPILPADYSDIDAIRVGDDYYAISSTFQYQPGMVVLHSKDLVNWRIVGHAVNDVRQVGPELNHDRMNRYGRGIWAGAIRHHAGRFWVYFGAPDEGFFVTSAVDPAGPWEPLQAMWKVSGWNDPCPFWDDDGQGYFVCTHFAGKYKIYLFKMTPDNRGIVPDSGRVLYQGPGSEASKLYRIDGVYYHLFSEVHRGRSVWMRRATSLDGPWEQRQLNQVDARVDREPNQGGLIQVPDGSWWFPTHQGTGDWEGRAMCLLPVRWIDGWPILGKPDDKGLGRMVWSAAKPINGHPVSLPQASDEFDEPELAVQWEWNHYPRDDKWSLTERPGFLRLGAFKPLKAGDLLKAGNTLTQRGWRADHCEATVRLDVAGMADGQHAGLARYARTWCTVGVHQAGGVRTIERVENGGPPLDGPVLKSDLVWLRTTWGRNGQCQFSYSTDGRDFADIGQPYALTWGHYRGDRIGIFSYNDDGERGYVDVDSFHLSFDGPLGSASPGALKK